MEIKRMSKKTTEDWRKDNEKKIKFFYGRGFSIDSFVYNCYAKEWKPLNDEKYPSFEEIMTSLDDPNNRICRLEFHAEEEATAIICSKVEYLLLKLPTMVIYSPLHRYYVYLCKCDKASIQALSECTEIKVIPLRELYVDFKRSTMPQILMPKGKDLKLKTLPELTYSQVQRIIRLDKQVNLENGYNFQINHGSKYRIPSTILQLLSNPILTVQEKRIFEEILLTITNSIFVLDTSLTGEKYKVRLKDFIQNIKITRSSDSIKTIIKRAFDKFILYDLIDDYVLDDTGMIIFSCNNLCSKLKRQNITRERGFYDNIPGTKQATIMACWLDYLYLIASFTRDNKVLQIALDTLFEKLELTYLIDESRLSRAASIMTTLSQIAVKYGFLTEEHTFSSSDIKHLLKNRQGLKGYMVLVNKTTEEN